MRERTGRREGREIPEREVFERQEPRVRRKVSRVESLKRILFNRGTVENEEKKRRSKSAEAEVKRSTVDKGCGPDSGLSSEGDEILSPRASCLDLTSEIGEFDSVSQISCMDSHDRWHFVRRNGSMSVSSDMLSTGVGDDQSTIVSSASQKRGQFPYAYLKSKLTPLPEELGPSGRTGRTVDSGTGGSLSEVGSKHSGLAPSQRLKMLAIRRKKSQSLADLHQSAPMVIVQVRVKDNYNVVSRTRGVAHQNMRRVDMTQTQGKVLRLFLQKVLTSQMNRIVQRPVEALPVAM